MATRDNWLLNKEVSPNFVKEKDEVLFPGMGFGEAVNFVPDANALPPQGAYLVDKDGNKKPIILHPEQEKYGIDHVPGTEPKPRMPDPNEKKMQPW